MFNSFNGMSSLPQSVAGKDSLASKRRGKCSTSDRSQYVESAAERVGGGWWCPENTAITVSTVIYKQKVVSMLAAKKGGVYNQLA